MGLKALLSQIEDIKSTRPRLPPELEALMSSDVLIPTNPSDDKKYHDWCLSFVNYFKGEKVKKHQKGLDALRVLDAAGVSLGYTVRRIYEYVLLDLQSDDSLLEVKSFRSSRSRSQTQLREARDVINSIKQRMEMEENVADGLRFPQLAPIKQMRAEMMSVMSVAIAELDKLYELEMESSRLESHKFVQSTLHNSRLNYLLPPEWYSHRRRRFWSEIASIMDTAAAAIIEMKESTVVARVYNPDQVRIAAGRVSRNSLPRILKLLLDLAPDFLDKVQADSMDTAIAGLPKRSLRPSIDAQLISELSRKLRSKP